MKPLHLVVALAFALALVTAPAATPSSRNQGPPTSIAALGDSITMAACTDPTCADLPQNSWSTGTNPAVQSHLLRLRALFKHRVPIRVFNFASSADVTVADLADQAQEAVHSRAAYVTIEIGENDLCGGTPPATFRRNLERGLAPFAVRRSGPEPKILLLSIENVAAHWRALRADPVAAKALKQGAVIDCGLGYYTATKALLAKIESRAKVLNQILADVCSSQPLCLFDAGTYYRLPLKASYFSPADYQHLTLAGQRALAAAEWKVAIKFLYE